MQRAYGDFAANFNVNYSRISYSLQKIARWRSLIISLRKKTEITEKLSLGIDEFNLKLSTEVNLQDLVKYILKKIFFFITEKDGNNRNKRELLACGKLNYDVEFNFFKY